MFGCVATLDQAAAPTERRDVPDAYSSAPGLSTALVAARSPATSSAQERWEVFFADPNLRALITEALASNQELGMRAQEIVVSRNEVAARRGEYLPKVGGIAGAGIEKVGKYTSQGASDEDHGLPEHLSDFSFGFAASWEVDIWGKLRKAAEAANHRYLASTEAQRFLMTEVVAEIASSYYELLAIDAKVDVLERNIVIQEQGLESVKYSKQAGRATELAVQKFEAEIRKNKATRFALAQDQAALQNRIYLLLGRYPTEVRRDGETFATWHPPEVLAAGLPSELLSNRLDVRAAERELEAAKLEVEVARASFYPALNLDLRLGFQAFNPVHLLSIPESLMYDVASGLVAPVLNRAAITAEYRSANAQQIQAVLHFEQTLLRAFTEVATQLARLDNLTQRYAQQAEQVRTLQAAVEVSNLLYQSARAEYLEVLMTRRDSLEAEMDLIETKLQEMQAMVQLYRALGGGWR